MGQGSIIGYEINEKTCQISFYNDEDMEPDTLEVDSDNYQIPLIIGKLRDTWAYGKEAKRLVSIKEGFTVTRLLSKSLAARMFGDENPIGKIISYNHERELVVRGTYADLPDNTTVKASAVLSLPPAWAAQQANYSWNGGDSYYQLWM